MVARAFQLISIGPNIIEGIPIQQGDPAFGSMLSYILPPSDSDPLVQLLQHFDQQLENAQWEGAQAVLVFPTEEVSIRKLEFPFREQKKIDQALIYELENELLEDVAMFSFDYIILPQKDGTAKVLIYLVSKDYLQGLLNVCQLRNLIPIKATFSAQALQLVHPPSSHRHYYVYIGPDEIFIACCVKGNLENLRVLHFDPSRLNESLGEEKFETIAKMLEQLENGGEGESSQELLLNKNFQTILREIGQEIFKFIRSHFMGEIHTLSLHGLFASHFHWDSESQTLDWSESTQESKGARNNFHGLMGEYLSDPKQLVSNGKINFHRRGIGWLTHLKEFKRPLIIMGLLVSLTLTVFLTGFFTGVMEKNSKLEKLDAEIKIILLRNQKGKHDIDKGVKLLKDQMEKLEKNNASSSRFQEYHYDVMVKLKDISKVFKDFPNLTLGSISFNPERFSISGITDSYNASESLKNRLTQLKYFQNGESTVTHQRSSGRITYNIVIPR